MLTSLKRMFKDIPKKMTLVPAFRKLARTLALDAIEASCAPLKGKFFCSIYNLG
jgi:hypothetical protein